MSGPDVLLMTFLCKVKTKKNGQKVNKRRKIKKNTIHVNYAEPFTFSRTSDICSRGDTYKSASRLKRRNVPSAIVVRLLESTYL